MIGPTIPSVTNSIEKAIFGNNVLHSANAAHEAEGANKQLKVAAAQISPFIIAITLKFNGDSTMDFDNNVKIAHQEINCPGSKIAETATTVTSPSIGNTGDCMGDALRGQKKDTSKFSIDINSDGSLTFHSDGWPDLKLKKKALFVSALSGTYEGGVPCIIAMTLKFNGDSTMDFDYNVKIARHEINGPSS